MVVDLLRVRLGLRFLSVWNRIVLAEVLHISDQSEIFDVGVVNISTDILEVDYPGEDITISVQASSHWTVVANYAPPTQEEMMNHKDPVWYNPSGAYTVETGWIIPEISEGEVGDTRLTVHVKATTGKSRYGSLIFKPPFRSGKTGRTKQTVNRGRIFTGKELTVRVGINIH